MVASMHEVGLGTSRGVITPEAVLLEFDTAGVPSRALARIVDTVIAATIGSTLLALMVPLLVDGAAVAGVLLIGFLTVFGYPCLCETVWSTTPGKSVLGLRVISEEGGPVRFRQAAIRSAMQVVDLFIVPVGVVAVISSLAGRTDQRLGDRLAGTLVARSASLTMQSRAVGFPALPGHESYVASLDIGTITPQRYEVLRSFLTRVDRFTPGARGHLADSLAGSTAAVMGQGPAPWMHPEVFLASVAAAYQQRHGGPATWMWGPGSTSTYPPATYPPSMYPPPPMPRA